MSKIDAHHHFWNYDPVEYAWIDDQMKLIRRDFLPADLEQETLATGISGVISVQARQSVEETRWLLDLARTNRFIQGVVGWVPLIDPGIAALLDELRTDPKLRAVRHILQGEPDPEYMLRDDFNRGVSLLKDRRLAYDILIFERHLPQTLKFVDRHPNQVFIVDHLAKPRVRENQISPWREKLRDLARRENVYCKVSGLVTEADYASWTPAQLRPYMDIVLNTFTPRRVMFGSDWPVCLAAVSYGRWFKIVEDLVSTLSPSEQERVWSGTAREAYRLPSA